MKTVYVIKGPDGYLAQGPHLGTFNPNREQALEFLTRTTVKLVASQYPGVEILTSHGS